MNFRQIGTVTALGLRTIPLRLGTSLVIVIGMACAVGALLSTLSLSTGFMQAVNGAGRPDRAMVVSRSALFEFASSLTRDNVLVINDAPGIKRLNGKPVTSADALTYTMIKKKSDGLNAFIVVRGIGPQGLALRPEVHLIAGRMFRPGKYELIVGKGAQTAFVGLDLNKKIALPESDWLVTGIFETGGDSHESELLTDATTLQSAARMPTFKSATVQLDSPAAFDRFKAALTADPRLAVDAWREQTFLEQQSHTFNMLLAGIAYAVGGIMGLGAVFGALNTMYSAVSARSVEIATLRAIGFGGGSVVISVLVEAMLLAALGAAIGAAAAWAAFNGNLHTMGGLVIRLAVTPPLLVRGVVFAALLGLVGGLFPAIRAARLPIVRALRAT